MFHHNATLILRHRFDQYKTEYKKNKPNNILIPYICNFVEEQNQIVDVIMMSSINLWRTFFLRIAIMD